MHPPADCSSGDEPMTGAQRALLKTLCEEARQAFDDTLSRDQAARRIAELKALTTHGDPAGADDQDAGRSTAAVETVVSR